MKRVRRMITTLLVVCMVFGITGIIAHATSAELRFSDPSTTVGAEVEVTARFTATDSIQSMEATLTYDTAMLRFVSGDKAAGSGGQIMLSGAGDGTAKEITFSMTFQALAEGSTVIQVASSAGTDTYQQNIDVVNGSSTVTIGPGDPSLIVPEQTEVVEVMVDGVPYTLSEEFTDLDIPEGFELSEMTLDGVDCKVVKQMTSSTILAYLKPSDGGDPDFYLYNPDDESFAPFEQVSISSGRHLIFLDDVEDIAVPEEFVDTTMNVAGSGKVFPAWQNINHPEFYLIYGLNSDGTKNLYLYDTVDGSYQRYILGNDTAKEDNKGKSTLSAGKLTDKLVSKLGNFMDFLLIAVAALIAFLLLMLLIVGIKLRHRNLELDDLYDEYGIDMDDEEEPEKIEKKAKKGKKGKKSEDDMYAFDDVDDEYDKAEEAAKPAPTPKKQVPEETIPAKPVKEIVDEPEEDIEDDLGAGFDEVPLEDEPVQKKPKVRAKKASRRSQLAKVGPEPKKQVGHSEEDDTFKMNLIDLD